MVNNVWLTHTTDDELWDWDFGLHDVHNVTGDDALLSEVVHAVLLRRNELQQVLYEDKGSTVYDYIPQPLKPTELSMIAEALKINVTQIQGINDAVVVVIQDEEMSITTDVIIQTEDGKEIEIDGI